GPAKGVFVPLLDAVGPEASGIGAVNTIVFRRDGRIVGENTDGEGFLRALRGRIRFRGARAVLVGAGGSARAVAVALVRAGCASITIANRTLARAERLAERVASLGATAAAVPPAALARGAPLAPATVLGHAA